MYAEIKELKKAGFKSVKELALLIQGLDCTDPALIEWKAEVGNASTKRGLIEIINKQKEIKGENMAVEFELKSIRELYSSKTKYPKEYSSSWLWGIDRMGEATDPDKRVGYDKMICWEFSFLNREGIPQVYILDIQYPANSNYMIELKSLELYLHSFRFFKSNRQEISTILKGDLRKALKLEKPPHLAIYDLTTTHFKLMRLATTNVDRSKMNGKNIEYKSSKEFKFSNDNSTLFNVNSHLVELECPFTGRAKRGSVEVKMVPNLHCPTEATFLQYILSYRGEKEFQETFTEKLLEKIMDQFPTRKIAVQTFFQRVGGIELNCVRALNCANPAYRRLLRH